MFEDKVAECHNIRETERNRSLEPGPPSCQLSGMWLPTWDLISNIKQLIVTSISDSTILTYDSYQQGSLLE